MLKGQHSENSRRQMPLGICLLFFRRLGVSPWVRVLSWGRNQGRDWRVRPAGVGRAGERAGALEAALQAHTAEDGCQDGDDELEDVFPLVFGG